MWIIRWLINSTYWLAESAGYIYKSHSRFYTKYVSEIESDSVGDYTRCRESLKDLGMTEVSDVDCSALRYVCECVSRRAGFMVSLFKPERAYLSVKFINISIYIC